MESDTNPPTTWLDRSLSLILPRFNLETLLIGIILVMAVISRFYNVDLRVMSHDEVNHVVPSWELFTGKGYRHDPVTHGPMQFHLVALSYFLFGDNDLTSRLPAVLFSIATVAVVLLAFRRYLGRSGALIGGFLFLISPFLLFYGRYTRNEAFVALFGVLTLYSVLRYLEKGKNSSLLLLTTVIALHFCTKETSFIYMAQLLLFLLFLFIRDCLQNRPQDEAAHNRFLYLLLGVLVLGAVLVGLLAWKGAAAAGGIPPLPSLPASPTATIAASKSFLSGMPLWQQAGVGGVLAALVAALVLAGFFLVRSLGVAAIRALRSFDLLILVGTLVLPQLTAFPVKLIGWDPLDYSETGILRTGIVLFILLAVSVLVGIWWRPRFWLACAGIFYTIFVVLFTTFFTNGRGFFTGLIGSLGYWLAQQGVQRGGQPWYYFALIQVPIYEYLAALGTLVAVYFGVKYRKFITLPGVSPAESPAGGETGSLPGNEKTETNRPLPVLALLVFWSITSLIAYSLAGEKMPWLTVHVALPLLLTAGWGLGYLVDTTPWRQLAGWKSLVAVLLMPVFLAALASALGSLLGNQAPFQGKTLVQLEATNAFILSAVATVASGIGILRLLAGMPLRVLGRFVTLVFFGLLAILTARTAYRASYINYDSATEYMVYAHAARGPKDVLAQVEEISRRTTGGKNVVVAYDNDGLYPYWWYFRDYPNKRWFTDKPTRDLREVPLIIAGEANFSKLEPIVKDNFVVFNYNRLWWPNQDYWNLTWQRLGFALTDPKMRSAIFDIWLNRDFSEYARVTGNSSMTPETWQPANRMRFYVRKDIVAEIWNYGSTPVMPVETKTDPYASGMKKFTADTFIGFNGSQPGQFQKPRSVAVAPDGTLFVADSGNHRIQHLTASGEVLQVWGAFADISKGEAPGGTFNEPWGIAVAGDGSVYVSDTWNHRVQKFNADGQFVRMWGYFGQGEKPDAFWGPRGVAVDEQNRVYVTDTGNKRIAVFTQDGDFIGQFGTAGMDNGQFDEPVAVAVDSQGLVYVTDTWNQRVQVFQPDAGGKSFSPLRTWEISGWYGQSLDNKPFIAVGTTGTILVSDPEGYRVLEFDNEGHYLRGWGDYLTGQDGFGLVTGITVDAEGRVWVVDTGNDRLLRFTLPPLS